MIKYDAVSYFYRLLKINVCIVLYYVFHFYERAYEIIFFEGIIFRGETDLKEKNIKYIKLWIFLLFYILICEINFKPSNYNCQDLCKINTNDQIKLVFCSMCIPILSFRATAWEKYRNYSSLEFETAQIFIKLAYINLLLLESFGIYK